ncbi:MAG: AI-2E family transporter, partial [Methyloceanibacter sp.]
MPPRSPFPLLTTPSDARAAALQGLLIGAIVIAGLYVGREVLLPLALAILLSFVLTPPLLALRRIKVPRVLAVGLVVTAAFAVILALGWLMSREATNLAADLPNYRATLSAKIESLRAGTGESKVLKQAGEVLSQLQAELAAPSAEAPPEPAIGSPARTPDDKPVQVEITTPEPTGWALYQTIFATLLPPLATAGIVLLLVIFILLQREDLRDRLIRLFGGTDLQRATSTMTDAASRLSRYFLSQVLINFAYGAFIAAALWLIGLPSPIAWGILAMLMRFVPYVGGYLAAALPLLIAAAIDPGWTTFVMVLVLFLVGELTMGQVIEPLVFGRGTGVTPIAGDLHPRLLHDAAILAPGIGLQVGDVGAPILVAATPDGDLFGGLRLGKHRHKAQCTSQRNEKSAHDQEHTRKKQGTGKPVPRVWRSRRLASGRVVHVELDRVRGHAEARDLL